MWDITALILLALAERQIQNGYHAAFGVCSALGGGLFFLTIPATHLGGRWLYSDFKFWMVSLHKTILACRFSSNVPAFPRWSKVCHSAVTFMELLFFNIFHCFFLCLLCGEVSNPWCPCQCGGYWHFVASVYGVFFTYFSLRRSTGF